MSKPRQQLDRREFLASLSLLLGGCTSVISRDPDGKRARADLSAGLSFTLSEPFDQLKSEYSGGVIGSGYGASVIAARLAGHFGDLCVLERGREWQPGEFPSRFSELTSVLRTPFSPLGLIDVSAPPFSDMDIISGNGLGGTSLLNAAIAIRPEPNVFLQKEWPKEIRSAAKRGTLENYYARAESVLKPKRILSASAAVKSMQLQQMAGIMGRPWQALNLNIQPSGGRIGLNEFGVPQGPCMQCGDCCGGCNYGAKNTLATNYLALAKKNGAKIFTRCEVVFIKKTDKGYDLHVKHHGDLFGGRTVIHAKHVFLGAGSKGSTELLMRSQNASLDFSNQLGRRLSANGDVMAMAYNSEHKNASFGTAGAKFNLNTGPTIASYVDYRSPSMEDDVQSQFLLLDGVVPSAMRDFAANSLAAFAGGRLKMNAKQLERMALDSRAGGAHPEGALAHTALYFACGHDSAGGRYELKSGAEGARETRLKWDRVTEEPTFRRINSTIEGYANALGGVFIANPRTTVFGQRIQATHPLGGCPMGGSATSGVVNHSGQVYSRGGALHAGLYVVDAAIIPRSLAATPLLTISALAERIAVLVSKET